MSKHTERTKALAAIKELRMFNHNKSAQIMEDMLKELEVLRGIPDSKSS